MVVSKTTTTEGKGAAQTKLANSYYAILGLHPAASVVDIRRSYRDLSKRYHPDTTNLPPEQATKKFQQLNEAYATLSNPERRSLYDFKIGYSRYHVIQIPQTFSGAKQQSNKAYLDPTHRPLSAGEIFALFILGFTFVGCLILVLVIGWLRGELFIPTPVENIQPPQQQIITVLPQYQATGFII
ncbi:MAG: J domain-containing protein [Gomphosphaeria aponina SAG 52.96 = DSM 107014]|uniref:J domain-containing protein n=1 Tax=Gomphosphaeria aponina SAG 52.96 = DSM 107014 TaxID=1521640 RepID=A0A941GUD6_9CHRO|nr:J domain-containing protein [Gomphosphaeria aponina SAG 52.96 = DSM 107014]